MATIREQINRLPEHIRVLAEKYEKDQRWVSLGPFNWDKEDNFKNAFNFTHSDEGNIFWLKVFGAILGVYSDFPPPPGAFESSYISNLKVIDPTQSLLASKSSDYCFGQGKFWIFEEVARLTEGIEGPEKAIVQEVVKKVLRLISLVRKEQSGEKPNHEGIADTIQDLKGYGEILKSYYEEKKQK